MRSPTVTSTAPRRVVGYGGLLDIRPKYQREFVYDEKKRNAVIDTIRKGLATELTVTLAYVGAVPPSGVRCPAAADTSAIPRSPAAHRSATR